MSDWKVDVLSFQKIFSFCGLKGHIVEIRGGVTLEEDEQRRTTECEDRARILGSRIRNSLFVRPPPLLSNIGILIDLLVPILSHFKSFSGTLQQKDEL